MVLKPQFDLVPLAQHDVLPPYFVYCGLVFQVLSLDYLTNTFQSGAVAAPKSLLALFESSNPSEDRFEVDSTFLAVLIDVRWCCCRMC